MFPSSFRPVSENRRLRKLSNVHSPMYVMSCVRFGNFFLGKFVKYFSREMLLLGGFLIYLEGQKHFEQFKHKPHALAQQLVVLQSVLSRRTFLVEMSMWLVKSRPGLVLEKRHFYFVMLFLFFFPPGLLGLGYNREDLFSRGGLGALGFGLNWGLEDGICFAE